MISEKLKLIDTHAHIQFPAYNEDREAVIERAKEAGVGMIAIGTQYSTSLLGIEAVQEYPESVFGSTVGFHPNHLDIKWHHDKSEIDESYQEPFEPEKLKKLAEAKEVVAIGECGLDYYRLAKSEEGIANSEKKRQREAFIVQIEIAHAVKKPLVIHCRSAFPDLIETLFAHRSSLVAPHPGIIHFFSGTYEEAKILMDLGFYIAFGGVITFVKDYEEIVKKVPLERIVLETDAPYVAPMQYRGKKNEPAYIVETAKKVAELKGVSLEEVTEHTLRSVKGMFTLLQSEEQGERRKAA